MTRGARARVVLLLRCAAETAVTGDHVFGPGWSTAWSLGLGKRECAVATRAVRSVAQRAGRSTDAAADLDEYLTIVLEAALRIEEGSWP